MFITFSYLLIEFYKVYCKAQSALVAHAFLIMFSFSGSVRFSASMRQKRTLSHAVRFKNSIKLAGDARRRGGARYNIFRICPAENRFYCDLDSLIAEITVGNSAPLICGKLPNPAKALHS